MGVVGLLDRDHVLALAAAVAERRDRRGGVAAQPLAELGVDPRPGHDPGTVARPDPGLVGVDQLVERGRVDVALLGQQRLERPHPDVHLVEFAVIVLVVSCS